MAERAGATIERPGEPTGEIGRLVRELEISRAWLVDPVADREGPGEIVVSDGRLKAVTWLDAAEGNGVEPDGVIVAPGFVDLHAHLREPGFEDAETVASGLAAAAHGGFTTVCAMPNTNPAIDDPSVLERVLAAAARSGSPVELLAYGALTTGRRGESLAALGELSDVGAIGFSDDGAPIRSSTILRNGLLYAGMLGRPLIDHAGRGLAILADVLRDEPRARLHFTHLSTAAALDLVRQAKAAGLPVTCDVTPHHLGLTDTWIAGARDWAWRDDADPWLGVAQVAAPYDPALRVNPPLRDRSDARACLAALLDGTADAVATDHGPHTRVDKAAEFGQAANGISGIETAIGILLAAVDAGRLPLGRAIAALTSGPAALLQAGGWAGSRGLVEGAPADLVVIDRSDSWRVDATTLRSKGKNNPLIGRELPGRVLLTVAGGRLAYEA
jgi:dihydroorotase